MPSDSYPELRTQLTADERVAHGQLTTSDLKASARELRAYGWSIGARSALTLGAMLLYHYRYLPLPGLILANLLLYPEIYLRIHDIGHACSPRQIGLFARFVPVTNPIWGGTRVFATIHHQHHLHLGTDRDPWLPYYTGHPLRALFFNFVEPEYSCWAFILRHGVDRELALNLAYNTSCLLLGSLAFGGDYLTHLLILRCVHCVGIFFFNFYTHRESLSAGAPIGTWERAVELGRALPWLRLLWGRDTIDGLVYHNRHHCLGQQHLPVRSYSRLVDTGVYTRGISAWPIAQVHATPARGALPPTPS
jgi:hypothetical protein